MYREAITVPKATTYLEQVVAKRGAIYAAGTTPTVAALVKANQVQFREYREACWFLGPVHGPKTQIASRRTVER